MDDKKVGFIGAGNMAYAIGKALVSSGVIKAGNIMASARTRTRLDACWKDLGTKSTLDNEDVVKFADIIFLSVKPHLICDVIKQIKQSSGPAKLFISVAAGITIATMNETFGVPTRIVRTMPNTPCMVECGVIVYALSSECLPSDGEMIKTMLDPIGLVEEVPEKQIDAISSLIGCSIAWYQMVIESMADGGVKNGVPRALAYKMAAKSMEGSAKLVLETGNAPAVLKDQVTSPGGSTICGLYELEQSGIRGAFMKAVDAATKRNQDLGKK
ncbi:pyrroline-5-carboxylate reductase 3-like isoform X2 [Clytia hemisphaerica]|uniref:Pyrroline-5-carboxylate reductase n=1 Tax=Clytia hemisphaerica TaxID=252671 RepID=A0A7M5WQQ0_9CNID